MAEIIITRRLLVGKTVRGSSVGTWMGRSTELWRSICSSKTRIILIGTRGRYVKWLERSRIWLPCGRNWCNRLILMSQIHFLIMNTWDALSVNVNRIQRNVRITNFCWSNWKNYQGGESLTQKRLRCPATWNDMLTTCVERYCELANKKTAIVQSFKPLLKWSTLQERGAWISGRMIQCMHTVSWNACTWHELVDQTSHGH